MFKKLCKKLGLLTLSEQIEEDRKYVEESHKAFIAKVVQQQESISKSTEEFGKWLDQISDEMGIDIHNISD